MSLSLQMMCPNIVPNDAKKTHSLRSIRFEIFCISLTLAEVPGHGILVTHRLSNYLGRLTRNYEYNI